MGFGGGGGGSGCRTCRTTGFGGVASLAGMGLGLLDRATGAVFTAAFRGLAVFCGLAVRPFGARAFFFAAALPLAAEPLAAEVGPDFFAFFAGAFPVDERLVIGFKRTDLPARVRVRPVVAD